MLERGEGDFSGGARPRTSCQRNRQRRQSEICYTAVFSVVVGLN